jgi:propionyl-CoA synthetase
LPAPAKNVFNTIGEAMSGSYEEAFSRSISDPDGFWGEAAEEISWYKKWDKVLDDSNKPFYRWFGGAKVNTCYNAIDRHVEAGNGDRLALIYDSPVTNTIRTYTYKELLEEVSMFAGVLVAQGVGKGDRVIIYMPMIPAALIAMMACARIGAVHSVVFGGFASSELAVRINDAQPKVIVSASCGIEGAKILDYKPLLDGAIEMAAHKPRTLIIKQRPQKPARLKGSTEIDWDEAVKTVKPADCVPVEATDPLYILYTSGTTGQPKGVVRDNGGHLVALNWTMKNIYDIEPGEVFWAASDVGWVVGHSYIVYAPLIHGSTTILFEGKPVGTPDAGVFWRVIAQHKVKSMFTAPTAFRAIKREDPKAEHLKKYDLSDFKILFLAGERTDPDTLEWAQTALQRPVIDHWWQTETGWAIAANCMGLEYLPVKPGSPTKPVPGWNVVVLDETNNEVPRGQIGAICVKLPLPPGALPTLWKNDEGYVRSYLTEYPGSYMTADAGYMDEDGYVYIMARTDDVINVAGHRLSTGAMEEVLSRHPDVAECAVVGVADSFKGQLPVGFMVLKMGATKPHDVIVKEVVQMVREYIGPVAAFKTATVVDRLPKTRSGKILRGTIQKIADNEPWKMPATIDDPAILDEIREALEEIGYASAREKEPQPSPGE